MDGRQTRRAGLIRKLSIAWLNGMNALRDDDAQGANDAYIAIDKIGPHKADIQVVWDLLEIDELLRKLHDGASRLVI